mgnify:CR=1 FL=1
MTSAVTRTMQQFARDDSGATAIEYGLIAAMIAVALIATFVAFGSSLTGMFGHVNDTAGAAIDAAT